MSEEDLLIVHVPALVAVLMNREIEKGSELTEAEVLKITDRSVAIAMPVHAKDAIAAGRGYNDIDPERAWEEWRAIRPSLYESER